MIKSSLIKIYFPLILYYFPLSLIAEDSIQISLLSCSPGTELYSTFGHSAFRIKNFKTGEDIVYNYGTFHFNDKNFYLKFLQGKLNYYLTVGPYDRFMYEYTIENRAVFEQVFVLNEKQKEKLSYDLKINALPENRAYKYDFFWDNCSTRIRDMIQNQYSSPLLYPSFKVKPFRAYLHDYLGDQPWSKFGIDLILGLPCDASAGTREAMFLPLEMMKAYDSTLFQGGLVATPAKEILTSVQHNHFNRIFTPFIVSSILFLLTIAFYFYHKLKTWGIIIVLIAGLAGCIIFFLWFLSDHLTTKNNLHLIWANPVLLLYPFKEKIFRLSHVQTLGTIYFVLLMILILVFPINMQRMPIACIPIWLSLMLILWPETRFYKIWEEKRIKKVG